MTTVIRVAVLYVVLLACFRVLGKRELSSLSPFELVTLMLIPEILSPSLTREDFFTHHRPGGRDDHPHARLPDFPAGALIPTRPAPDRGPAHRARPPGAIRGGKHEPRARDTGRDHGRGQTGRA
jgi:hypothetical protein